MKKVMYFIMAGIMVVNLYGCVALVAGTAGGAGTAYWLSEKMTQEVHVPYERTAKAAKSALVSLKLEILKETKDANVTQFKSEYYDKKDIWIDVKKISDTTSQIEVRVGGVKSDKAAADKILKRINRYL